VPPAAWPRRALRLAAVLALVLGALGVAGSLPLLTAGGRVRVVRGWFRALLRACGVRLVVLGGPGLPWDTRGTLVTANHVSWLDVPALMAVDPVRVLAKSDVRRWPVVGLLAARAGTVFIDRDRLRRLPVTVAEIAAALRGGQTVAVFPEGSTWCGRTTGRFYPATLQAAVDAGAPVRPVVIRYRLPDGSPTTLPAFVGDDTLLASLRRVLGARRIVVEVELMAALPPEMLGRRRLASASHLAITARRPARSVLPAGSHRLP
jgi:1-acyl-sn-glycerol-3-phosphate acyltransferase